MIYSLFSCQFSFCLKGVTGMALFYLFLLTAGGCSSNEVPPAAVDDTKRKAWVDTLGLRISPTVADAKGKGHASGSGFFEGKNLTFNEFFGHLGVGDSIVFKKDGIREQRYDFEYRYEQLGDLLEALRTTQKLSIVAERVPAKILAIDEIDAELLPLVDNDSGVLSQLAQTPDSLLVTGELEEVIRQISGLLEDHSFISFSTSIPPALQTAGISVAIAKDVFTQNPLSSLAELGIITTVRDTFQVRYSIGLK